MVKKNIKNTIEKHNLINAGEHIVIGLSGGPDSVCLFSVLNDLKEELNFTLHAVHVNHGFRPGAADEDQKYAEQLCRENEIECTSFKYDCNEIAKQEGLSSEEAGRKARYESFLTVADELIAQGISADKIKIAVAQNADDQAETVLFRLMRGTGTDGLAGMAYSRMERNIAVIRPLLDTWRKEIEGYCVEHSLNPRVDHTNLQSVYTRNKIRLELIPYLQENFNPNIMESLGRLSKVASEDKEYLWKCAEEAFATLRVNGAATDFVFNQQGLAGLVPAIRHRVVMKALQELGLTQDVTFTHLEALDAVLGAEGESKMVEFPDGYRVSVRYGEVAFYRESGTYGKIASFSYNVCQNDDFDKNRHAPGTQAARFDADKIAELHGEAQPVLRTRQPGDYISINGGRKKIQNLFVDMKVPREHRDTVKVVAVGSEILWIPLQQDKGIGRARYSHRFKLDSDTKNVLTIELNCGI